MGGGAYCRGGESGGREVSNTVRFLVPGVVNLAYPEEGMFRLKQGGHFVLPQKAWPAEIRTWWI